MTIAPNAVPAKLYRDYGPVVYRRCLRLLGDRAAAQDATRDVFAVLVKDPSRLGSRETALPWVYRVAMSHCLRVRGMALSRGQPHLAMGLNLVPAARAVWPDAAPEGQLTQAVLSELDEEMQMIAVGVLVDGMEQAEVASILGASHLAATQKLDAFVRRMREARGPQDSARGEPDESLPDQG